MNYWLDENLERHTHLPKIWKGVTPFNEMRAAELGWTKIEEVDPAPEPEDTTERDNAEREIVKIIVDLASRYDAIGELGRIQNLSIPSLLDLATRYGVTAGDLQQAINTALIWTRHLEAVTNLSWGDEWEGLKERFAGYLEEIINSNQGEYNE